MEERDGYCPVHCSKGAMAKKLVDMAVEKIRHPEKNKINLIWLEATGCSGNIISMLDGAYPDFIYLIREMVNFTYNNSVMAAEGELAFEQFLKTLDTDFILVVEGAVSVKENGLYTIIARYKGKPVTAMEAVQMAGEKAKYVLTVGTCASSGGPSAASPNPSGSMSVGQFLNREVIRLTGCPCHPDWVLGTIANIILYGSPKLDNTNRPIMFYGVTIHDNCTRRSYFDSGVFAEKLGDKSCMFKLGCRGPITKADCPVRKWNEYVNWPIGVNTPCIGCTQDAFPDGMEPFVRY